jgi:hypothetical protein
MDHLQWSRNGLLFFLSVKIIGKISPPHPQLPASRIPWPLIIGNKPWFLSSAKNADFCGMKNWKWYRNMMGLKHIETIHWKRTQSREHLALLAMPALVKKKSIFANGSSNILDILQKMVFSPIRHRIPPRILSLRGISLKTAIVVHKLKSCCGHG